MDFFGGHPCSTNRPLSRAAVTYISGSRDAIRLLRRRAACYSASAVRTCFRLARRRNSTAQGSKYLQAPSVVHALFICVTALSGI